MIARLALGAIAVVVIGTGAACGGDGNGADAGTAAKRNIQRAAQERAESIVLRLSDFPDEWRASSPDEEDAGGDEKFRKCVGADYSTVTFIGEAESKDFKKEESEASSGAEIFESEEQAREALQEFSNGMESDAVEGCFRESIEQAVADDEDFEVGEIDIGELSLTPPDVDEARAWQVAVSFKVTSGVAEGMAPTAYLDVIHLRQGDTIASVQTQDVFSPFDPELRDQLLSAAANRMSE